MNSGNSLQVVTPPFGSTLKRVATDTQRVLPSDAIVDPRLRVHGIRSLRVADASIMPLVVGGNTNAPSIMIGEKCAAKVLEEA